MVDEFDLVVWGEVLTVRDPLLGCFSNTSMDPVNVRIEVIEGFAGAEAGDVVTVQTPSSGASCGVDFQPGDTWLIFAMKDGNVSLCGPSRETGEDDSTLVELRESQG
jgi:hypothetical protein